MKVDKFRTVIIYIIIILLGLVCLLPLLNIVAISFSSSAAVEGNMVGLSRWDSAPQPMRRS